MVETLSKFRFPLLVPLIFVLSSCSSLSWMKFWGDEEEDEGPTELYSIEEKRELVREWSSSLGNDFLSKISEIHHKHKKDHPSGTALMLGKGIADGKGKNLYKIMGKKYFNKKTFPYSKKINFNSLRRGEVVGEHEVKFSSGKEIITLNHEAFDRALYSEGALTAAKWLINKKPGLYSMRDVLNFK